MSNAIVATPATAGSVVASSRDRVAPTQYCA